MTLKNLGKFYGITLLIGLVVTVIVSLIFGYDKLTVYLVKGEIWVNFWQHSYGLWDMGYLLRLLVSGILCVFIYPSDGTRDIQRWMECDSSCDYFIRDCRPCLFQILTFRTKRWRYY